MTTSDNKPSYVLSATQVQSVEMVDGGETLAVRLRVLGDDECCVLLPIGVVGDLLYQLADAMSLSDAPPP